jgi:oxygen-dependent protoporphyrinogen oxidase
MADPAVVVIGGGITGLTAARTLTTAVPEGTRIVVLEASERLGGKLQTNQLDGIQVEDGADSFLAREPEALRLCTEIGIRAELASPEVFGGLIWTRAGLRPLPAGTIMGIPTSAGAVLGARMLSPGGKIRALGEPILPGRLRGNDVSVATLIRRRFGREVLERMVDPLLAGTRAGDTEQMSLRAALPRVDRAARAHRSLMLGLRKGQHPDSEDHPLFYAPRSGMQRLIQALRDSLGDSEVHTGRPATKIRTARRVGYLVDVEDGGEIEAAGVVVAVPAPAASKLLAELSDAAAGGLERIHHASVAIVTLVYEAGSLSFPVGSSGFLVPKDRSRILSGASWWSEKWPHTIPDEQVVVRAFIGRSGRHPSLDRVDTDLSAAVAKEVNEVLGASPTPVLSRVARWDDALPQYEVGHSGRVSRIEGALEPHQGIVLAGADYRGAGISDCIRQGINAARRVAASL